MTTVTGAGWAGIQNGKLLRLAAERYDVFVTMDGSIEHQQNRSQLKLRIVVLRAALNRLQHLVPLVPELLRALQKIKPGQLVLVGR